MVVASPATTATSSPLVAVAITLSAAASLPPASVRTLVTSVPDRSLTVMVSVPPSALTLIVSTSLVSMTMLAMSRVKRTRPPLAETSMRSLMFAPLNSI